MLLHHVLDGTGTDVFKPLVGGGGNKRQDQAVGALGVWSVDDVVDALPRPEILVTALEAVSVIDVNQVS